MEFETLWDQLEIKYREEFPWSRVESGSSLDRGLVQEACREIQEDHPLYGKTLKALAKCGANDDVLFAADDAYAVIHLTWWSSHNRGDFPDFLLFDHIRDALAHLERENLEDCV